MSFKNQLPDLSYQEWKSVLTMGSTSKRRGIRIEYIQPGKPTQNAYIERFNKTMRDEVLDMEYFDSIEQAQFVVTQWHWIYNNERPHEACNGKPPKAA